MTIAISLKVNDGLVLAADSASTLIAQAPSGEPAVINVYNNANKIFNLRKGLPIGATTWGAGSIGPASISTLANDLRRRFTGEDSAHPDWHLDPQSYSILSVAERLRQFMYEEHYVPSVASWPEGVDRPSMGFVVAGYSAGAPMAEEYQIVIDRGECGPPVLLRPLDESGLTWNGQPEAISRLIFGLAPQTPQVLAEHLGVPSDQIGPAMEVLTNALAWQLVQPAMPFQDAIDLAEFLVDLTIKASRFLPGAPTVGGEIEVAAVSKHEGFKWIKRKHYFSSELNPYDFRPKVEHDEP
jgi:hypothetical protein